jgi:hypothetical protein
MSELPPHQKRQAILSDHKRIGKRFIPPFMHTFGGLQEVKWVDVPLPELLWLGLLNHRYGLTRGAELGLSVARAAAAASAPEKVWLGPISAYGKLTRKQQQAVVRTLKAETHLYDLKSALGALVALYPECPLDFLLEGELPVREVRYHLSQLKIVLADLFDKTTKEATFMQANGVYIAFVTDMLIVSPETSLANFPSVFDYPHSEDAKRIAASVRAAINGFFGMSYDNSSSWPSYFWNRGLEIDQCVLGTESKDE